MSEYLEIYGICIWAASSEFGTNRLCEQRRFRRACASTQSRQYLRCLLIQAVSQEEPSDRKPDPWPLWMAVHGQWKFVMMEWSKTQIRLTRHIWLTDSHISWVIVSLARLNLIIRTPFWFISVFESTAYLKFTKLQYVSSGFSCRVITGSLMRLY